jgi:hypothetical protein
VGALIRRPAEGGRHPAGPSPEIVIKATGDGTAGTFFLAENVIAPGFPGRIASRYDFRVAS